MGSTCAYFRTEEGSAPSYEERQKELSSGALHSGNAGSSSITLKSSRVGSPGVQIRNGGREESWKESENLNSDKVSPNSTKELYSYKLAAIEDLIKASERKQEFCKTVIEVPMLLDRLKELECSGKIILEAGSNFGMVVLDEKWQELQEDLMEVLSREKAAYREDFISQASRKANEWGKLLGLAQNQIGFFTPTSSAGLHISLGKIDEEEKPECVVEDKEVRFLIKGFTTMPSMFALPKIYPSQRTTVVGDITLMNCPTRWYFINVEVEDFDFPFKYPPHITLGCYGLMNVPQAAVKEMHKSLAEVGSGCADYEYGKSS